MRLRNSLHIRLATEIGPFAGTWTPAQLFAAGEQGAWYDPSDSSSVFQDAACTTPAGVGDVVGCIQDKSGNGNHATQTTTASKPILRQDAGGKYYLDFDDFDDFLTLGTFALPVNHHEAIAYDMGSDTVGVFWAQELNTYWAYVFESGSSATDYTSVGFVYQSLHVDGSSLPATNRGERYTALNGKHVSVWHSTTTEVSGAWRIGRLGSTTSFSLGGGLYGLVWRDSLSDDERPLLESYLATKSGVTL